MDTTAGRPPQFFVNQITAVALDARGEVFVAGDFSPRLTCGATTLVGVPNEQHAFFARLAGISGQWLWAVAAQGTTISSGRGLAVDAAGVLYAVGDFFGGGFRLGTAAVGGRGGGDGFAARLDPATGQSQWVRVITSFGFDDAYAVVADGLGCWVGGAFSQQITLGPTTLTASGSASNAVLAHLNAAGSWTSASGAGGDGFSHLNRLTRLEPGEVVLTGSFQHEAVFGFDTLRATGSLDAFVARYVAGAAQPWQALGQVGGADLDFGNGLTTYRGPGGAWGFHLSGAFRSPVVTLGALPPLTNVANTDGCAYLATWSSAPLGTPSVPSETAAFTLAPNPAATLTRLTLATSPTAPLPVTVLDALGRPVRRATLEAGQTEIALDVRGLPAGLYVVRAGQQTGRLVVE